MKSLFARSILLMAAAEAAASTGAAPTTTDPALVEAAKPKRAPKNPENTLDIINGRLPLVLGFLVRFKLTGTNGELAKKLATSVGKIFDLKKGRNFAYLTADYKPSAEEVAAGKAWFDNKTAKGKTAQEAGAAVDEIKAMIDSLGVATAEEVSKRNWAVRTVGAKAEAGTAPAAPAAAAAAASPAAAPAAGAKMF